MMFKKIYFILIFTVFLNLLVPYKAAKAMDENKKYLILDEVYVIDDLNDIVNKINYLYDLGIPFIISTMPIFKNMDIEAAQRYYEVLRYAQVRNVSIVLHFPDISEDNIVNINMDELINKMNISYNSFINYDVYPIGIDIPKKFLTHENITNYLRLSDTLFVDKYIDISNIEFKSVNNFVEKISYNQYDEKIKYRSSVGIAIPSNIEINEFKDVLESLSKREIYFNDFSYLDTFIKIGENELKVKDGNLYLNNKNITVQRFISREEFKSTVDETKVIVEESGIDLTKLNRALIIITAIATIIFIVMAISNRRIDRNKFFK